MNRIFKIGICSIAIVVASLLGTVECQAATQAPLDSVVYSLYFRHDDDLLMKDYRGNEQTLNAMAAAFAKDNASNIVRINIVGSTSPDGVMELNEQLALRRAEAVRGYIIWRWDFVDREAIKIRRQTNHISALIQAVDSDVEVPRRDKVLKILHSDASIQTKWANIKLLNGSASRYIEQHIFPQLRNAVSCEITFTQPLLNIPVEVASPPVAVAEQPETQPTTPISQEPTQNLSKPNKPLFALKTNLLFDAAAIINLELEVPIGNRWSIAGEIIFPWWLWENQQHCIQVMSGTIEGRYWFGDRIKRPVMTGWFVGAHVGGGYYDIEWDRKGYQGEFFLAAGVSGGYAHTINKRGTLRMEYSLGVGFLSTNYRSYEAKLSELDNSWHLYRKESGQFSWVGPTRVKISLVWLLDTNLFKKRGGRR